MLFCLFDTKPVMLIDLNDFPIPDLGTCHEIDLSDFDGAKLKNKFSILNLNLRSIRANFVSLQSFLDSLKYKVSIIVITETWLSKELENIHTINGYKVVYTSRNSHGGGWHCFFMTPYDSR